MGLWRALVIKMGQLADFEHCKRLRTKEHSTLAFIKASVLGQTSCHPSVLCHGKHGETEAKECSKGGRLMYRRNLYRALELFLAWRLQSVAER